MRRQKNHGLKRLSQRLQVIEFPISPWPMQATQRALEVVALVFEMPRAQTERAITQKPPISSKLGLRMTSWITASESISPTMS